MKIKTSELTGAALDWAVAKAEDWDMSRFMRGEMIYVGVKGWFPSTDWSQGGPIIERERISVEWLGLSLRNKDLGWTASAPNPNFIGVDPTPLIAAMRCYVAFKLGDEVDVPEELLP